MMRQWLRADLAIQSVAGQNGRVPIEKESAALKQAAMTCNACGGLGLRTRLNTDERLALKWGEEQP
jgi:hypothetical protein